MSYAKAVFPTWPKSRFSPFAKARVQSAIVTDLVDG